MIQPTALIIEDDPALATIFQHALNSARYETEVIHDGQDAIEHLSQAEPYLILLDLHLPKVNGSSILKYIRMDDRLKDKYVIVCSADGTMAGQLLHSPDLILNKPVSMFQLQHLAQRFHPKNR